MKKVIALVGQSFGDWTVISLIGRVDLSYRWLCRCICGTERSVRGGDLRDRTSQGCGCNRGRRKRPYEASFNGIRYNALREGRDFSLTYEQFLDFTKTSTCHYCGSPIAWRAHNTNGHNRSNLDRKDNSLGYLPGNCVVCCGRCNRIKSNHLTYDEMLLLSPALRKIVENSKKLVLRMEATTMSNFSKIKIGKTFTNSDGETFKKTSELEYDDMAGIGHYIDPFFDKKIGQPQTAAKPDVDTSAHVVTSTSDVDTSAKVDKPVKKRSARKSSKKPK